MAGFEDEGRGPLARDVDSFQKLGKARKWILPRALPKEHGPEDILV